MKKKNIIYLSLILSFFIHIFVLFPVSLYIEAKGTPILYFWPDVLNRNNLFKIKKKIPFPSGVDFSLGYLGKAYFFSALPIYKYQRLFAEEKKVYPASPPNNYIKEEIDYFYLWDRPAAFLSWEKEKVSYKVLISPYGKIILSFPDKLPFNSYGNIFLQEHMREAVYSFKDRFFWTKVDGVVE
jgi:hypothetical protein